MAVVCLLGPVLVGGCATVQKEPLLTDEQRQLNLESFDYVWTTIHDKHWDPELGGLDWQAVHDELQPRLEEATVMSESRAVMAGMVARLGKSHFAIVPAKLYKDLEQPAGEGIQDGATGIDVRVIDGHALVTSVQQDSPAADLGVRPGWRIVRIGEDDLDPKLADLGQEFDGETYKDLILSRVVDTRLRGRVGDTVLVRFLDGEDQEVDLDITLAQRRGRKVRIGHLPGMYVWIESRRLDGDIGYIAFSGFFDPNYVMGAFNEAMKSFMDVDGIVIDVRGNPGGIGAMAMGMAGWFIAEKEHRLGTMYTRDNELKIVVFPRAVTYDGPVALLIDGLSGSCSEIFAGGLKDLGRVRVFGSRTAGAALPSTFEKLPNGDGFQYAFANYVSQGGEELEGVGVIPHVELVPTREALLQGKDPVLEAAVDWIRDQQ